MQGFDWYKYAVGGAASRPDSFSKLNPEYATRVAQLIQAADQELGQGALKITSAYRSPELQAQLFAAAVKKYGSEAAARKWVAPPGRSKHNSGMAVDFADASGSMLRDPNSREAQWIKANAGRFGLDVPMSWEPWQVELAGGRSGIGGGIAADTMRALGKEPMNMQVSTKGQPMGLLGEVPQDEPGGLLSLLGANRPKWTDKANDIGAVLLALSGTPGAGAVMQGLQERKKDKRETQRMNQTIAWLRSQGRDDLASAVMSGGLSGAQAAQIAVTPADPLRDLQVQKAQLELAQMQAGKDPNVQSSQLLPDQSGVVLVMRDGSVKVRTAGDQELAGQEALDFVQQAQKRSADYQRSIYGARREGTLGADIQLAQEAEAAGARGAAIGKAEGEAKAAEPGKIAMVNQIEGQVNDLLNDPYLPNMLGPVASRLPNLSGDAARVQAKMDQLSGGAFLQARQLLKGGGAITDFESKKAEQAFIRMNAAQEIGDFRDAMNDFLDAIKTGLPKLQGETGQPSASAADMSDDDLLRMYGN